MPFVGCHSIYGYHIVRPVQKLQMVEWFLLRASKSLFSTMLSILCTHNSSAALHEAFDLNRFQWSVSMTNLHLAVQMAQTSSATSSLCTFFYRNSVLNENFSFRPSQSLSQPVDELQWLWWSFYLHRQASILAILVALIFHFASHSNDWNLIENELIERTNRTALWSSSNDIVAAFVAAEQRVVKFECLPLFFVRLLTKIIICKKIIILQKPLDCSRNEPLRLVALL